MSTNKETVGASHFTEIVYLKQRQEDIVSLVYKKLNLKIITKKNIYIYNWRFHPERELTPMKLIFFFFCSESYKLMNLFSKLL